MLLSARMLDSVVTYNDFIVVDEARFTEGDSLFVYFMLIDLNKDNNPTKFRPSGRRYIPAVGATVSVTIKSNDDSSTLVKVADQPFPADDRSIWRIQILATDELAGTFTMQLTLTEGATVTHGVVRAGLSVNSQTEAFC